jgi:predicted  nucleic acid-binding Zn-ribbon protein
MSATVEIEQLQNEKTRLEEEGLSLDEKLKQLERRWKLLNEQVVIQDLKSQNAAKQEAINQLQSKISQLEARLETLHNSPKEEAPATATQNAESQQATKETADASAEAQEKDDEDTIKITALDNEEEISEKLAEQANHQPFY